MDPNPYGQRMRDGMMRAGVGEQLAANVYMSESQSIFNNCLSDLAAGSGSGSQVQHSSSSQEAGQSNISLPGEASSSSSSQQHYPPASSLAAAFASHKSVPTTPTTIEIPSQYLLEALGERWQFYLAVLYSLTAITSFILNVITVIVLSRIRRSELRKYLINLSVSDLLMSLFSIPFTYTEYMLGRWIFAAFLCPLVRFVVTLSVFVSAATMTVIGINRHSAIMHPLRKGQGNKFRAWIIRKNHVILIIWLIGIAISMPEYLMFRAEKFCYNKQYYLDCRNVWPEEVSNQYTVFIYLITFAIPLSLLSYLYTRIGLKLWRRKMPGNVDRNRDLTMQTMRIKVIKMLFVVVILFAVSWLPLQTFSMVLFLYPGLRENFEYQSVEYNIFIATYFISHWLSMAHSCLNPLIYCFMNDKFRCDLQKLLCKGRSLNRASSYNTNPKITIIINNNNNGCSSAGTCCRDEEGEETGKPAAGTGRGAEALPLAGLNGQFPAGKLDDCDESGRRGSASRKSVQFRRGQLERTASTELRDDNSGRSPAGQTLGQTPGETSEQSRFIRAQKLESRERGKDLGDLRSVV